MTFLAVAPWVGWTLFLLTLAAITIIFFLRIQHRQVLVSSHLLWERVLEKRRKRSWLEWLRRILSLLIALLIGGSLVLAFTEAELGDGSRPRRVTLVIDNGLTMGATMADGRTRLERALDEARDLLSRGSGADRFTVVDRAGRVIAPADRDRTRALAALDTVTVSSTPLRIPAPEPRGETWLLTDGVGLQGVPDGVKLLPVFEAVDNAGVTAWEIRATPSDAFAYEAFLEVGNFSPGARSVRVEIRDGRGVQFRRDLQLEANGFYRNTFDLSPLEGGPVQARVTLEGDGFALDDAAWVHLPRARLMRVALVARADSPLAELLGTDGHVQVTRMSLADYRAWDEESQPMVGGAAPPADPAPFDGVVFEGVAPEQAPRIPALLIAPPAVSWLPTPTERVDDPGAVTLQADAELLENVDLHDLHVDSAARVEPGDARVLLAAGEVPLLLQSSPPADWILTTFSLADSDLGYGLSFPVLLSNVLQWWRDEAPTVHSLPGRVSVPVANAAVVGENGAPPDLRSLDDRTVFTATAPGIFMAHSGRRTIPVAVGLDDRTLSAVNRTTLGERASDVEHLPPLRLLWPTLLAIAAVLLIVEGLTYNRRITV